MISYCSILLQDFRSDEKAVLTAKAQGTRLTTSTITAFDFKQGVAATAFQETDRHYQNLRERRRSSAKKIVFLSKPQYATQTEVLKKVI